MARKLLGALVLLGLAALVSDCGSEQANTLTRMRLDKMALVATVPFNAPILYKRGTETVGPDARLAERILEKIREHEDAEDIRLTWLVRTYRSMPTAVAGGEAEIALGVFGISEERKKTLDFATPHYKSELVLAINPLHRDVTPGQLDNLKIGVRADTVAAQRVRAKFPNSEIVEIEKIDDLVLDLRSRKIDAVIGDRLLLDYAIGTGTGVERLEVIPEVLDTIDCAVAVRKGDKELLGLINAVVEEMLQTNVYAEWLNEHVDESQKAVEARGALRKQREREASRPRTVVFRISKDPNFQFDIFRLVNLPWIFRNTSTGEVSQSNRVDFRGGRIGYATVRLKPGEYDFYLQKWRENGLSGNLRVTTSDPRMITVNIRISESGITIRYS